MEHTELLNEQTSVKGTTNSNSSNEELISTRQIGNTPFTMLKDIDKGYSITLGQQRITEWNQSEKELEEKLENLEWGFLISTIAAVVKIIENENK